MSWRVARSLLALRGQINTVAPGRNKASDGTIGDPAHSARTSDHNPNSAGVVCAIDITHDPVGGADMRVLAQALVDSGDPRIKYVIWNWRIWTRRRADEGWRVYRGSNGHATHLHLSVDPDPALYDNPNPWAAIGGFTPAPQEADVLKRGDTGNEVTRMQWRVNRFLGLDKTDGADGVFGPQTEQRVKQAQAYVEFHQTGVYDLALEGAVSELLTSRKIGAAVAPLAERAGLSEVEARELIAAVVDDELADLKIVKG